MSWRTGRGCRSRRGHPRRRTEDEEVEDKSGNGITTSDESRLIINDL